MRINSIFLVFMVFAMTAPSQGQELAIKTNLLYGVYTGTPNLSLEIGAGRRGTIDLSAGYNGWNLDSSKDINKKLVHWMGQAEYRYWLCEKFTGSFFGLHALGSQYNISNHELPMLLGKGSKNYRYQGWAVGAGLSYGHQWLLSNRWNLEASVGAGYIRLHYNKYDCAKCGERIATENRNYFGPTRATISLLFLIK